MKLRLRLLSVVLLVIPMMAFATPQVIDKIVAVVNDSAITATQMNKEVGQLKRRLAANQQGYPADSVLQKQVLDHLINQEIQEQLAAAAGIKIDDSTLDSALTDIAKRNNMTLSQLPSQIVTEGMKWSDYRETVRQQLTIEKLRQIDVAQKIHISDKEINQFMASAEGQSLFSYDIHLANLVINIPDRPTQDDLAKVSKKLSMIKKQLTKGTSFKQLAIEYSDADNALKGGDLGWHPASELPTLYVQATANLDQGEVSKPIKTGNGLHLVQLIGKKDRADKKFIKQYKVRHILIKADKLHTNEQAKALIKELRQKILNGASFAEIAQKYSADPGSASLGGVLGWVSPGDMVPQFDQQMKATPVGDLSPVFHTSYGWHILQVGAVRDADVSKEYRRSMAANALHQRYYEEQLQLWLHKIRSEAYVDIRL